MPGTSRDELGRNRAARPETEVQSVRYRERGQAGEFTRILREVHQRSCSGKKVHAGEFAVRERGPAVHLNLEPERNQGVVGYV